MDIGTIRQVNIDDEMRDSYLDYAMSVIVARALPDARDGMKPVHRRILYAMHDMGIRANSSYKKSARIVGEVLGKYHPHGDGAVYDAMARMAQDFSLRYMLVDGQGNFGSIDGDSPAAMRYTEARLSRIAEEMIEDIDRNTVDFIDNFDGSLQEPLVLPAKLPNLLLNGTSGIAVGMATNIPPHNLRELTAAITFMIDRMIAYEGDPDEAVADITVDDLMEFVKGPDFPTGAMIVGGAELKEAYATGKGRIVMRAKSHIEEMESGRFRIVVTEIPYQVNKSSILERIAELVRDGRLETIANLRDESDRRGMAIAVELKRSAQPRTVLNRLLKYTQLQTTFGVQMLALVNGEPRTLSLRRALFLYIDHRRNVIRRRSEYELGKARARAHILEGLLLALADIDDIIKTIRGADDTDAARAELIGRFNLSEPQANAILDMQLRRLAALERQKIEDEYRQIREYIEYLEDLLRSPRKILALIRDDLQGLADKYGDDRRTELALDMMTSFEESDLVRDEEVLISLTERGYIKRVPAIAYRSQRRGGKGVTGMTTRDEDAVEHLYSAGSLDHILFFTDQGKVYAQRAYMIPEARREAKGTLINAFLALQPEEYITAIASVPTFDKTQGYFVLCTHKGRIKRVPVKAFSQVRSNGLIAMSLDEGDYLGWVKHTTGDQDLILVTRGGQSIRFNENDVRVMGRNAGGVSAIRFRDEDEMAAMDVIDDDEHTLLVVTEKGYGKRTSLSEYTLQHRYGYGIRTLSTNLEKTGPIIDARVVSPDDGLTLITAGGIALRTEVSTINIYSRATSGVQLMHLAEDDALVSIAIVTSLPEEHTGEMVKPEDGHESETMVVMGDDVLDELDDVDVDELDDALLDEEDELLDEEDLGDEDLTDEGPLLSDEDITYGDFDGDEIDPGSDGRY
ncbi:MAG TPA: DNA gyrase subunit A [Aggregatilinea sp.]|uniref:DNA gyrase subunit A n=1 Tax=Aggregatilinea sp. TaxID=2806333 RepID=UPI002C678389|nr:DNA gyrase subunit A [Aggregatilinea sp.]HML24883.1 DNA gyrase subunit A [Aggregatilinea sp.]